MLKLTTIIAGQIQFLLRSLNDSNVDSVLNELSQFLEYGLEGSIALLQTCLEYLYSRQTELNDMHVEPVLVAIFKTLLDKPNFSTVFSQSLGSTEVNEEFLEKLSRVFQLAVSEKVSMGLALCDSENLDTRMCARKFCISQIDEMCANSVCLSSVDQIQNVILFLQRSEGLSKHVDHFMEMLSLTRSKDTMSFVLTPWVSDQLREDNFFSNADFLEDYGEDEFDSILAEIEKERSMGDIVKELGYGCTLNSTRCREILSLFVPLNEITIAKILGTIICCHTGLEENQSTFSSFGLALGFNISNDLSPLTSWDVDVLVNIIKELAPSTNWQ